MAGQMNAVGRPHRRVDGLGKVTGRTPFAADLSVAGMLWGRALLARRPHARILAVDTRQAQQHPGVFAVLTADDLPAARRFGVVVQNQAVLADDKVRHYGDAVAVVAASAPAVAEDALALIRVDYEDLPVLCDPEAALEPGAPLIHDPEPNVCVHHRVRKGEIAQGFAEATTILERTYRTPHVEHAYLEPEALLATPTGDGGVHIAGSVQNLFSTRRALAAVLGLDLARVTVEHTTLGGSFGGKDEVMTQMACRAALLARATGRPIKMVNTREQSFLESYKRHPYVIHYKVGVDDAGRLTALQARVVADAGAYASLSPFVTWRSAVQITGPYECPHVAADVTAAYTNNCYTGAMRGFGSPQINFAIESLMDELAVHLNRDPLDLRRQNVLRQGSITATGQRLDGHKVAIGEVLQRAGEAVDWPARRAAIEAANFARTDGRRAGLGLACSFRGVSLGAEGTDAVGAIVAVQSDGSVILNIALTDMGQGVQTALSLIAAEVLGIDTHRVVCFNAHTGRIPDSGPSVASRATVMGGQATKRAATSVRDVLFDAVAGKLGVTPQSLVARGGRIEVTGQATDHTGVDFDEAVALAYAAGRPLLGFGWHRPPATSWDPATGTGDAYFTFVYGANLAEVEVDTETGKVDVLRVTAVHDVGRAISPAMVRTQIYGGIAMGIGYGLLERHEIERGIPITRSFADYLLTTAMDMPEIDTILLENPDPAGPFGAKSIGEPATEIVAPAIANAIAHACGRRILTLPADLETVTLGRPLRRGCP